MIICVTFAREMPNDSLKELVDVKDLDPDIEFGMLRQWNRVKNCLSQIYDLEKSYVMRWHSCRRREPASLKRKEEVNRFSG